MSATSMVRVERFNTRGDRLELVDITVDRIGGQVYVYVKGAGPPKHYVMTVEQWRVLNAAAEEGEQ